MGPPCIAQRAFQRASVLQASPKSCCRSNLQFDNFQLRSQEPTILNFFWTFSQAHPKKFYGFENAPPVLRAPRNNALPDFSVETALLGSGLARFLFLKMS
jgi:hypothetical protein